MSGEPPMNPEELLAAMGGRAGLQRATEAVHKRLVATMSGPVAALLVLGSVLEGFVNAGVTMLETPEVPEDKLQGHMMLSTLFAVCQGALDNVPDSIKEGAREAMAEVRAQQACNTSEKG